MPFEPLTPAQAVALSRELDDVVTLLRHGRSALRGLNFVTVDSSVVFVCLASGAEKLLKLSLGLVSLESVGTWPPKKQMKDSWGHDIPQMDATARNEIRERAGISNARPYLETLLETVECDETLGRVLAILGRYAQAGRFHNLDALAVEPTHPAPQQLWEELETHLLQGDPQLLADLASTAGWDDARRELNRRIDASIASWQLLFYRAWQHGVLGKQARQWSAQLSNWTQ